MNLSPPMRDALVLMAAGWELGRSGPPDACAWLQQGKVGYGGASRSLHQATFFALLNRELVERYADTPSGTDCYRITAAGREALK